MSRNGLEKAGRRRNGLALTVATTVLVLGMLAVSGAAASVAPKKTTPHAKLSGDVTWAEMPGATPNWIWPLVPAQYLTTANADTEWMYTGLYWFGNDGQPTVNEALSTADQPTWSTNSTTLTIKMKGWKWSNGETVSAADVVFWMNMLKSETANDGNYVKGDFPDNVVSYKATGPLTVVFHLTHAFSHHYFLYNELSQVSPMPLSWDMTSATTKGDCATNKAGCPAVYKYLAAQSTDISGWASSPVWSVVDGAFKLSSISTDGQATFTRNLKYSGPATGNVKELTELPFTSFSAEWNAIKAGTLDYGYVPPTNVAEAKQLSGYQFFTGDSWQTNYVAMNFTNPKVGPIFKQEYVRQALEMLVDQQAYIKAAYGGLGYPTLGPIPLFPDNPYVTSYEKSAPFSYSPNKASKLLSSHGWKKVGGVATCESPGTGSKDCGAGITKGEKFSVNFVYASGTPSLQIQAEAFKSEASTVGVTVNLSQAPFNTVYGEAEPCTAGKSCPWEMAWWGAGWYWAPDFYPTGDEILAPGAGANAGGYNDPKATSLIEMSTKSDAALQPYENYITKQVPLLWMPDPKNLYIAKSDIKGVLPADSLGQIYPQNWTIK